MKSKVSLANRYPSRIIVIIRLRPSRIARRMASAEGFLKRRGIRHGIALVLSVTRMLLAAAAVLAPCATIISDSSAAVHPKPDLRIRRLEAFFRAYHCSTPYHISDYLRAAGKYQLDYRLLPAVSIRETTCGLTERQNNRWGYHPGRQSFLSIEEGIDFVARQLAQNPTYMGKTLQEKLFTYNPLPAYPKEVKRIMQEIEDLEDLD